MTTGAPTKPTSRAPSAYHVVSRNGKTQMRNARIFNGLGLLVVCSRNMTTGAPTKPRSLVKFLPSKKKEATIIVVTVFLRYLAKRAFQPYAM